MVAKLRELVAVLRERTWLSPLSAQEMNHRDRWLADQIEAILTETWQPIETAPKDGTRVLISCDHGEFIAYWSDNASLERCHRGPAWQIFDCEDCWYSWAVEEPTHWMPLPKSPEVATRSEALEASKEQ